MHTLFSFFHVNRATEPFTHASLVEKTPELVAKAVSQGVPIEVEMYWKFFRAHYMSKRGLGNIRPMPRTAAFLSRR